MELTITESSQVTLLCTKYQNKAIPVAHKKQSVRVDSESFYYAKDGSTPLSEYDK